MIRQWQLTQRYPTTATILLGFRERRRRPTSGTAATAGAGRGTGLPAGWEREDVIHSEDSSRKARGMKGASKHVQARPAKMVKLGTVDEISVKGAARRHGAQKSEQEAEAMKRLAKERVDTAEEAGQ